MGARTISAIALAGLVASWTVPVMAKPVRTRAPAVKTIPAGTRPPNAVSCVFDALAREDREIALILLVDELERGAKDHRGSQRLAEIDTLLGEAHDHCLDAWPWTAGKSANAMAWAASALYREANAQAVSNSGRDPAVIDAWFAEHRAEILKTRNPARLWTPALERHLGGLEWGDKNTPAVAFGALYLMDLISKDQFSADFASGIYRDHGEN